MPLDKTQLELQKIITKPNKRPYGAKVRMHVKVREDLGVGDGASVAFPSGAFVTILPTGKAPWEGGEKYAATLEGFPTAAAAEAGGRRLVQALLWTAVSTNAPLKFEYSSYEAAAVFERNTSLGFSMEAYGISSSKPLDILSELYDAYHSLPEPDEQLLLSMEIFCAAPLESSQRAKFLMLVSGLEPLAQQQSLGPVVGAFIASCVQGLKNTAVPQPLQDSLLGRLNQLKSESIRQALSRLVRTDLPNDPDAPKQIDRAYALRSQLVHNGVPADLDTDLEEESRTVGSLIRRIYSYRLHRSLRHPG